MILKLKSACSRGLLSKKNTESLNNISTFSILESTWFPSIHHSCCTLLYEGAGDLWRRLNFGYSKVLYTPVGRNLNPKKRLVVIQNLIAFLYIEIETSSHGFPDN